jgi:cation transport ATPase
MVGDGINDSPALSLDGNFHDHGADIARKLAM